MAEALRLENTGSYEKIRTMPLQTAPDRRVVRRNAMIKT